jgi:hypothetical protein
MSKSIVSAEQVINRFISEEGVKFDQERDDWMLDAMAEYASQFKESQPPEVERMKWVKASERLPEFATTFCLKVDGRCGFGKFFESEGHICLGFEAMNGFGTLEQLQFDIVEWLDESMDSTPQADEEEDEFKLLLMVENEIKEIDKLSFSERVKRRGELLQIVSIKRKSTQPTNTQADEDVRDYEASYKPVIEHPCDAPLKDNNSIWHNAKYRRLASRLFSMAADEFGNHGCNDIDETLFTDWTEPEKLQLAIDFENWNCGHLDDFDPNHIAFNDSALMSFFANMLNIDQDVQECDANNNKSE